jgi:hypothetical protein
MNASARRWNVLLPIVMAAALSGPPSSGVGVLTARAGTAPQAGANLRPVQMPAGELGPEIDLSAFWYARALPSGAPGQVALTLDAAVLAHSAGPGRRFRDVRIADRSGRQVPYLIERRPDPLLVSLPNPERVPATSGERATPRNPADATAYRLSLPLSGLPPSTLVLRTSAATFERTVGVSTEADPADARNPRRRRVLDECDWSHSNPEADPPPCALRIPTLAATTLIIRVDDGNNAPLPITAAELLLPAYRLRYVRPAGGVLTLYYGHPDLAEPRYDATQLSATLLEGDPEVIEPGDERRLAAALADSPMAMPAWLFYSILGLSVVTILALIVRLVASKG